MPTTKRHHSVRFDDDEWAILTDGAIKSAGGQVSTYVARCAIAGHLYLTVKAELDAQLSDGRGTASEARATERGTAVPQLREQTERGASISDGAARELLGQKRWRS